MVLSLSSLSLLAKSLTGVLLSLPAVVSMEVLPVGWPEIMREDILREEVLPEEALTEEALPEKALPEELLPVVLLLAFLTASLRRTVLRVVLGLAFLTGVSSALLSTAVLKALE
ncbi:hypothetical protein BKA81DRAFT_350146 [Phyllosticta paracitricarpa]